MASTKMRRLPPGAASFLRSSLHYTARPSRVKRGTTSTSGGASFAGRLLQNNASAKTAKTTAKSRHHRPFSSASTARTHPAAAPEHTYKLPPAFLPALRRALPHLPISTNPYDLQSHSKGESFHPPAPPTAVLMPSCTDDVATILRHCSESTPPVPVIPFGAGTSLEGHVAALHGGVSLDMTAFDMIDLPATNNKDGGGGDDELELTTTRDAFARVGAGVTRSTLNAALRNTGFQFLVDPGADATIGGMVACGASGTAAVKYGTMRTNVLGLECVLADGTVARCGTDAIKSSA